MSEIPVGSIVDVRFLFIYEDEYVTPDTLTGEIYGFSQETGEYGVAPDDTFTPTLINTGIYQYLWTPPSADKFKIVLTGEFVSSIDDIVHTKYFLAGGIDPNKTMEDGIIITMLGELNPLYVDPEDIMVLYPEGDIVEITEIIYRKSLDLESKLGVANLEQLTSLQYEYVVASVMCELSRIYGLTNSGLGGFASSDSFQLGDLRVEKGGSTSRLSSGNYDNGNANSWCELAAYLKTQLSTVGGTFRPVVAGSAYPCDNPMPHRRLRSGDSNNVPVYINSRWDLY